MKQRDLDFSQVKPPGTRGYAPYVRGSDTSKAAADSMQPHLGNLEARVLSVIRSGPDGRTDDEVEVITELSHQSASARRRGLVLKGLVKDSGTRRKTRSGRTAVVWIAIEEGNPNDRMEHVPEEA